jgi:hypothetical protein
MKKGRRGSKHIIVFVFISSLFPRVKIIEWKKILYKRLD